MDKLLYVVRRMSPRKRERSFQWEAESPETCDESLCSLSLCISGKMRKTFFLSLNSYSVLLLSFAPSISLALSLHLYGLIKKNKL